MSEKEFNPRSGIVGVGGKAQYLQVAARVRWLRQTNPDAIMVADLTHFDAEAGYAVVKASVTLPSGAHADNYGSAWRHVLKDKRVQQPDDVVEWATTTAYGRALGALGFDTGTALDESPDLPVDAPIQHSPQAPQRPQEPPRVPARPNAPHATVEVLPGPGPGPVAFDLQAAKRRVMAVLKQEIPDRPVTGKDATDAFYFAGMEVTATDATPAQWAELADKLEQGATAPTPA